MGPFKKQINESKTHELSLSDMMFLIRSDANKGDRENVCLYCSRVAGVTVHVDKGNLCHLHVALLCRDMKGINLFVA